MLPGEQNIIYHNFALSIGKAHGLFHRQPACAYPVPCHLAPPTGAGVSPHAQTGHSPGRTQGAPRRGEPPSLHRHARRAAGQCEYSPPPPGGRSMAHPVVAETAGIVRTTTGASQPVPWGRATPCWSVPLQCSGSPASMAGLPGSSAASGWGRRYPGAAPAPP
jgi:hypothetical protein